MSIATIAFFFWSSLGFWSWSSFLFVMILGVGAVIVCSGCLVSSVLDECGICGFSWCGVFSVVVTRLRAFVWVVLFVGFEGLLFCDFWCVGLNVRFMPVLLLGDISAFGGLIR